MPPRTAGSLSGSQVERVGQGGSVARAGGSHLGIRAVGRAHQRLHGRGALYESRGPALLRSLFPDFYRSPRYGQILGEFELDADSLAKLDVPPLPF